MFEPLPTEREMIEFLDYINYDWDDQKKLSAIKRGRMSSEWSYIFAHFIQCLSCKLGNHDKASSSQVQMVFSAVKNRKIDWAKVIFDDLLNKLRLPSAHSKKKLKREITVLYPRFLTAIISRRFQADDKYPVGNLTCLEIESNLLSMRSFTN